jgi:phage portal protein BeeE
MGLLSRLLGTAPPEQELVAARSLAWQQFVSWFTYNGGRYPVVPSMAMGDPQEEPDPSFAGYVTGAYKANGIVFACITARMLVASEARMQFRQLRSGRPGDLFGTEALLPLERPWRNGTTGDLLARMITDADLAGNFFAHRAGQTVKRMRPDWVTIVLGSELEPDDPGVALDAEVIGYLYKPGGNGSSAAARALLPEQVSHFAPIPDPLAHYRGMSWLTPVIREIMGDQAATQHKLSYFERGATRNYAVVADPAASVTEFREFVKFFEERHADFVDVYKTVFLGGGASINQLGDDLVQAAFKDVQGAGETRICMAARVPPIIAGSSEGLDSATYSNYGQARRAFADLTMRPLWRQMAGALASIIDVPAGAELWYDDRDIAFLQEDEKDAAEILEIKSRSIKGLTEAGFDPDSSVEAVDTGDLKRLKHTGLLSVQMQKPGDTANGNGAVPIGANDEPARRAD